MLEQKKEVHERHYNILKQRDTRLLQDLDVAIVKHELAVVIYVHTAVYCNHECRCSLDECALSAKGTLCGLCGQMPGPTQSSD